MAYFTVMSLPVAERRDRELDVMGSYLGRAPSPDELDAYRHGVAARASGIVELAAGLSAEQVAAPAFGWVVERCLQAAADHWAEHWDV